MTPPLCAVGESPLWNADEGCLYWVDIPARRVHRMDVSDGKLQAWTAPEMVACIALEEGGLVAGLESGIFSLRLGSAGAMSVVGVAKVSHPMPDMRFNDGRCDRQGRFWAGTMHRDMPAAHAVGDLYRYAPRGGLAGPFVTGLVTQNGLAWSPDGATMYLSDSHPKVRLVWAFDYDPEAGAPSRQRLFVDMNQHPGRPDGAAVDVDGCYWTCANDAGRLLRFTPSGKLDRTIEVPVSKPSMCAFGGAMLDTLYVTSIQPGGEAARRDEPDAGAVFALRPGTQGIAEARLAAH